MPGEWFLPRFAAKKARIIVSASLRSEACLNNGCCHTLYGEVGLENDCCNALLRGIPEDGCCNALRRGVPREWLLPCFAERHIQYPESDCFHALPRGRPGDWLFFSNSECVHFNAANLVITVYEVELPLRLEMLHELKQYPFILDKPVLKTCKQ